jgi:hypothetical protein
MTCEKGKASSISGASRCLFCPDGEVPDQETQSICIKCLAGEFMNKEKRECEICPYGHVAQWSHVHVEKANTQVLVVQIVSVVILADLMLTLSKASVRSVLLVSIKTIREVMHVKIVVLTRTV